MGTKILLFGEMSCGLVRQKFNCFAVITIVMFGCKPENTIPTLKHGGALLQEGLVHFTVNRLINELTTPKGHYVGMRSLQNQI